MVKCSLNGNRISLFQFVEWLTFLLFLQGFFRWVFINIDCLSPVWTNRKRNKGRCNIYGMVLMNNLHLPIKYLYDWIREYRQFGCHRKSSDGFWTSFPSTQGDQLEYELYFAAAQRTKSPGKTNILINHFIGWWLTPFYI